MTRCSDNPIWKRSSEVGGTRSRGNVLIFKHPNVHREFVEYSETQKLHIVSVYSNPYRWQRRREAFQDFRFHIEASPNVVLHVVEVAFGDRPHEVTTANNPLDLQLRTDSSLWIKECAINEGVRRFPPDWKYGGYVDGDFHFTRHDWALEAIHMLQHHSFVQLFSTYADLTGETATSYFGHRPYRMSTSFAWNHMHQTEFLSSWRTRRGGPDTYYAPVPPSEVFPFGHPPGATGGAWSWRRDAFEMVGGMLDTCILGSADWHQAFGLVQATNVAAEMKRCTEPYVEAVLNWQARAAKLTVSKAVPRWGALTTSQRMLFTAANRCALMENGGRFCKSGPSVPQPTSREIIRDCGAGRETNRDSATTWLDTSSNDRKTGRCCWGKHR